MSTSSRDRRHFHRIVTDKPAVLTIGDRAFRGQVLDISLRGLLVECGEDAEPPESGAPARARIQLDGALDDIALEGTVIHVEGTRIGVRCTQMDLESAARLRRLVELNLADVDLLERELAELIRTQRD